MKFTVASVPIVAVLLRLLPAAESSLSLDEAFLEVAYTSAKLSALAYKANLTEFSTGEGTWEHPDYDEFMVYNEEPDQALLVATKGKCYVAFRGTNANLADCELIMPNRAVLRSSLLVAYQMPVLNHAFQSFPNLQGNRTST